jgi:hypothetical protein
VLAGQSSNSFLNTNPVAWYFIDELVGSVGGQNSFGSPIPARNGGFLSGGAGRTGPGDSGAGSSDVGGGAGGGPTSDGGLGGIGLIILYHN